MNDDTGTSSPITVQQNSKAKAPRAKSTSYPNYSFQVSEDVAKKIYQSYGNSIFVNRNQLEETLDKSASHLASYVSAAGQYGLLEVNRGEGYKVTDLFLKLYKPLSPEERKNALLECISKPLLYSKLIQQFNNKKLPSTDALATILFRSYGIAENASKPAAKIFTENLKFLNLLDSENTLTYSNGVNTDNVVEEIEFSETEKNSGTGNTDIGNEKQKQLPLSTTVIIQEPEYINYPLPLDNNRRAWIKIPESFTNEDLIRIINFAEGLKYK